MKACMSVTLRHLVAVPILAFCLPQQVSAQSPTFLAFESGPVRPLALSEDGRRLFAVNTPDNRLEVFDLGGEGLRHAASVPVGMEPVAVAVRSPVEVWVVNHLSDSVSVVDVSAEAPRVVRTLLVGDEPRDVVFAGPGRSRAFVTTAHRGQHRTDPSLAGVPGAGDPRLTEPGIGRADVWVFDAEHLDGPGVAPDEGNGPDEGGAPQATLGGRPLAVVELFGDTPRALAVSPDGATVYAAVLLSGNRTTTVPEQAVCDGFRPSDEDDACPDEFPGVPGGNPGPATNHEGVPAPEVGLIVKHHSGSGEWRDELGRDWSNAVRFHLPDLDVFAIDAATLEPLAAFPHVGTVLFNMVVNPVSGALYVTNTEARNEVRFEGPGDFGGSTVQGHLAESRITVIRDGAVRPRHLNKHLDYRVSPAPPGVKRYSLATPLDMAVSSDGATLYVAAFGSARIGVFRTAELEDDTFDPVRASRDYIALSGGGPSGLILDEARGRLYVATRFDNAVAVLDLESGEEVRKEYLHNPEPAVVTQGRHLLYNAVGGSSNGEASCASCHVFGTVDGLAWDLGDPDGDVSRSPISILRAQDAFAFSPPINGSGRARDFHPMKGPMTTQTLIGLASSGALHWRGDRSTGFYGSDPSDVDLAFRNFVVAFPGLLGHRIQLLDPQMQRFADFVLQLTLPPSPIRNLDNSLTPRQQAGRTLFTSRLVNGGLGDRRCQNCHALDPLRGRFGTAGQQSFSIEAQIFKIPHLRNLYQKVGMFGTPETDFFRPGDPAHQGDQVRGFGFLHDGSVDTPFRFFRSVVFNEDEAGEVGFRDDRERRDLEQFLFAFESDLAPVVGQQATLRADNAAAVEPRIDLLIERAEAPFVSRALGGAVTECDLIVKGTVGGLERGGWYDLATGRFLTDRKGDASVPYDALRSLARRPGQELTFTCAPPGSGRRMGIDRDEDGFLDRDELDAGSDPADAASVPGG